MRCVMLHLVTLFTRRFFSLNKFAFRRVLSAFIAIQVGHSVLHPSTFFKIKKNLKDNNRKKSTNSQMVANWPFKMKMLVSIVAVINICCIFLRSDSKVHTLERDSDA